MYADDILSYLSKPEQSIEILMNAIKEFGDISGYTININKSEVMVIGCSISEEIKHKYAFHWDVEQIKYLISIPLSLLKRVKIVQINILPRFLFLFKTLPIYIVSKMFKQWNSIIMKFIWNNRKHVYMCACICAGACV